MEQRFHQRRRVLRIPPEPKHDEVHVLPAEPQRVEAAPHVDVELVALHLRAGVHDGVDAVVLIRLEVGLDDRADRQDVGDRRRRHRCAPRRPRPSCAPCSRRWL